MNLYRIVYGSDDEIWWVVAESYADAIRAWQHRKRLCAGVFVEPDPKSVELFCEKDHVVVSH